MSDTTNPFDALAPYPTDPETATAEELCRNYAVLAQANFVRMMDGPTADVRHDGAAVFQGLFSVVHLLRTFARLGGSANADDAAGELLADLEAPHVLGPLVWEWLTDYGIDPWKASEITAGLAEMQSQPETVTVRKDDLVAYLNRGPDMVRETVALGRLLKAAGIEK